MVAVDAASPFCSTANQRCVHVYVQHKVSSVKARQSDLAVISFQARMPSQRVCFPLCVSGPSSGPY